MRKKLYNELKNNKNIPPQKIKLKIKNIEK